MQSVLRFTNNNGKRVMRKRTQVILLLFLPFLFSCQAALKLTGTEGDDIYWIEKGVTRAEVDKKLGEPIKDGLSEKGDRYFVYKVRKHDDVTAEDLAGGFSWIAIDIFFLGLPELLSLPDTIDQLDNRYKYLEIQYDSDGRVVSIKEKQSSP
jgi:hypothetical protein